MKETILWFEKQERTIKLQEGIAYTIEDNKSDEYNNVIFLKKDNALEIFNNKLNEMKKGA